MDHSSIKTRKITHNDLRRVVEIHIDAFNGFFLTTLGPRFLTLFYSTVIDDPTGIALLAYDEDDIYGFAVGTSKPAKFYRRLILSRSPAFIWAALPTIAKNPRIMPHLVRGLSLPAEAARPDGWGTLLSIAVAREGQNLGIGHILMAAFLKESKSRGLNIINLLTDRDHNDPVNIFYQNHSFRVDHTFKTPEGRWMNEYVIDLDDVSMNSPR